MTKKIFPAETEQNLKVYDGAGLLLGRLASIAAKQALLGDEVRVVNCEKIIISGKRKNVLVHEHQRYNRIGYPLKGPKVSRLPHLFVRRSIRGMLPRKQSRGRVALKRVLCYIGVPEEFQKEQLITLEKASAGKLPNLYYVTLADVCQQLGAKL